VNVAGGEPSSRGDEELPVWRFLDLGRCEPLRAQAFAESVAESVAAGEVPNTLLVAQPAAPYISLGFHQSFVEEVDPGFLERRPVPVIRRVEGGGTTWLDPDQWFYELVYRDEGGGPGGPQDLARFLTAPARAVRDLGLPADLRLPSDLVIGDRKLSGNAGGDWADAHLLVGGILGRTDHGAMTDLLRLPHPGVRPLLRAEVERWVTSWETETGTFPSWGALCDRLLEAFRALGLFRVRPGRPTPGEESRFRSETVPRHQDPAWRELPPLEKPSGPVRRRVRVAGPHGLLVSADAGSEPLSVAVVDGSEVRAAYLLGSAPTERARRLAPDSPEMRELRAVVRATAGFG
jgi:lipoate-protein ligase A